MYLFIYLTTSRLFSRRCVKCHELFSKTDFVMRASAKIFHIDCFRCLVCNRQLAPGDEFILRDDDLICKTDSDMISHSKHLATINNNIMTHGVQSPISTSTCQNITNLQNSINGKMNGKCENLVTPNEFHGEYLDVKSDSKCIFQAKFINR
jgi:hypothetical protein